jgi:UDP-N-acetylglucosamine 1-carboxyvinyltransferase
MKRIRITGGSRLAGTMPVSGAKNAALPLLAAALLTDEPVTFTNVPNLADIRTLRALLEGHGAAVDYAPGSADKSMRIHTPVITNHTAHYDLVRTMRASILVLGPLLAREGKAKVSLPGGCAIGSRPVDLHLSVMEALGAEIELDEGYVIAKAPTGGLRGATYVFRTVSVGATENALMAASMARGTTVLKNAAREPEVVDLAECLVKMGAKIDGIGSDTLTIQGVERLNGCQHQVVADRIEAGTFAMAAGITDGDLFLKNARLEHLEAAASALAQAGVSLTAEDGGLRARRSEGALHGTDITTEPFPGFPTDLQAQFMGLMCVADGVSVINEHIFENRFMHVPELLRMGADIRVEGRSAIVKGVARLKGAPVMATDLRASVTMVLAGLVAEGDTTVHRIYHLDRGYEQLEDKLKAVGALIEREDDPTNGNGG